MKISSAFPSKYIKATDLQGRDVVVRIASVKMEDIGDDEHKPVLYFQGKEKGLVLNKTNANNISAMYGDDTDQWLGQDITLFTAWVDYQGKSVEAIRVRPVRSNGNGAQNRPGGGAPQSPPPTPAVDPFPPPTAAQKAAAALDDEVPF